MNNEKITINWNIDGIFLILLILFIVLKVTGVISWSWAIVLIPLWILLGIIGVACFLAIVIVLLKIRK